MSSDYQRIMEEAAKYITEELPKISGPKDFADILRPLVQQKEQEEFWVANLNSQNRIIELSRVVVGMVNSCQIHAREIFRNAIRCNAVKVMFGHNHPSGSPLPSPQDIESTRVLVSAGKIIGIEVLDHVVIGEKTKPEDHDFISFREANLL